MLQNADKNFVSPVSGKALILARCIKRGFDLVASLILLILCLPLFVILALLVKVSSKGPVFFVQDRMGYREKPFSIWKFRTMTQSAATASPLVWTKAEEARITAVGRYLRDYGLDELPQLYNIIKGDMSIIGPRPPLVSTFALLSERERIMFRMRPGVLSLAAVEGRRSITMEQRVALHVKYVEEWSLGMDVSILLRSIAVVLLRRDAEEKAKA